MKEQTLCVIDMQMYFSDSAESIVSAVVQEVKKFRQNNLPILIVEFCDYCDNKPLSVTYSAITEAVQGYDRAHFIKKQEDDGGYKVIQACKAYGFPFNNLKFVGVNRSSCVLSTIRGVQQQLPDCNIEVSLKATRDDPDWNNNYLEDYNQHNVYNVHWVDPITQT